MANETNLAEYESLRATTIARIRRRDNIIYIALACVCAMTGFAISGPGRESTLLFIPWAMFILGWIYISNDIKINHVSYYIQDVLTFHLRSESAPFGWEEYHNAHNPTRILRKIIQLCANIVIFVLSSSAALALYGHYVNEKIIQENLALKIVFWIDILLNTFILVIIVATSDVISRQQKDAQQ